jgi:hypothetical protein
LARQPEERIVIAAHQTMLAPQGAPSSLDYVQDGLYYQLDGIENAGRGVHSATATTWTDLTGNGRSATFLNAASGLVWQDNAAYLYGKTHDGIAKIRGLPSMTAFTFEIVSRIDSQESYARLFDTEAYGMGGKRFAGLSGTSAYPNSMSFVCGADYDLNYSDFPLSTAARAISLTPTKNGSNIIGLNGYLNGTYKQTLYPGQYNSQSASTYIDVANRSNSTNRGFDGAVFAIRCYNRILTGAEIAANYAIDKARFNLP